MKDTLNIKIVTLILVCIFAGFGCDAADPVADNEPAPEVLPAEAFAMDLNVFGEPGDASKNAHNPSHYVAAVWRVGVATTITGTLMYYPAVLTAAVQQVEPEVNGNTYIWAADTLVHGRMHGVELRARLDGSAIDWTMRVSGMDDDSGAYLEDFVLYEASTGILSNAGTFDVFYPINGESQHVVDGSYAVDSSDQYNLTISIPEGVENLGNAVVVYERSDVRDVMDLTGPLGGRHLVEWNNETHEGSLTADDYNNGQKACWNAAKENVDCTVM